MIIKLTQWKCNAWKKNNIKVNDWPCQIPFIRTILDLADNKIFSCNVWTFCSVSQISYWYMQLQQQFCERLYLAGMNQVTLGTAEYFASILTELTVRCHRLAVPQCRVRGLVNGMFVRWHIACVLTHPLDCWCRFFGIVYQGFKSSS